MGTHRTSLSLRPLKAVVKEILLVALVASLLVRAFWLVPERDFLGPFGMAFDKLM